MRCHRLLNRTLLSKSTRQSTWLSQTSVLNCGLRRCFSLPPHEIVGMPALSPSVERSKIVEWKKKEGDEVAADEAIAVVQTDKAELDWKVTDDVYLAKILLEAGVEVDVNHPVAVFVEEKQDVGAFANFSLDSAQQSSEPAPAASSSSSSSAASSAGGSSASAATSSVNIKCEYEVHGMPALSPTATEGAIVEWLVKEGDQISEGAEVANVQTDKSTVAWNAIDDGFVARFLVAPDPENKLPVGAPVAVFVENKEDIAEIQAIHPQFFISGDVGGGGGGGSGGGGSAAASSAPASPSSSSSVASDDREPSIQFRYGDRERIAASPYAKKIAAEQGVPLASVAAGSGQGGRITAADVMKAKSAAPSASASGAAASASASASTKSAVPMAASPSGTDRSFVDEPASTMRQVIASRLSESKNTSVHYYVSVDCELDELMRLRSQMNDDNVKVSVNDFIIKAAALALRDVPEVNVSWMGKTVRNYNYVDISVAVATPTGLITPIVTDADVRSLLSISQNVKELAGKAKNNKLLPHEFQGGTLTVSNLGMFGVKNFTAIINPPQSCIIAVGTARQELKPDSKDPRGFKAVTRMDCTISSDHRSVDGATAARYMQAFKNYIENPAKMLVR